jgi:hypothetical protein
LCLNNNNIGLLNIYVCLIEHVGWLNKHESWTVARAYDNAWMKEANHHRIKGLSPLDPAALDPEVLAKAHAKAAGRPGKEKEKDKQSNPAHTSILQMYTQGTPVIIVVSVATGPSDVPTHASTAGPNTIAATASKGPSPTTTTMVVAATSLDRAVVAPQEVARPPSLTTNPLISPAKVEA